MRSEAQTQTEIKTNLSWETHETMVSEAKVKIMEITINTKTTISGIDLQMYTETIKNTYPSTFGSYIKELLVQKYWQLISTKQLWSVPSTERSNSLPKCPGTEMSRTLQDWSCQTNDYYLLLLHYECSIKEKEQKSKDW